MSRSLKRVLLILAGLFILGFAGLQLIKYNTKKHSPEEAFTHNAGNVNFEIYYNRPYKKDREIFGNLVPFGEVWRTGANEATTFTTDKDVMVDGTQLPAGTYTLWTIPNKDSWKVIFNNKLYDWGVSFKDGKATRDPQYDQLIVEVPVQPLLNVVEQFSIYFQNANGFTLMFMAWDQTAVAIPIKA